jgi:hypothetical protein
MSGRTPSISARHSGPEVCRQHDEIERCQRLAHQLAMFLVVVDDHDRPARPGIGQDLAVGGAADD